MIVAAVAALLSFQWQLPPGFPLPLTAPGNQMSAARFELGRQLFYDRRLSGNGTQSCATCHQQSRAFTDGRATAIGSTGQLHTLNTMTLTNVAYNVSFTWSNPNLRSLEQQARVPMFNEHPVELGVKGREREILQRLREDRQYEAMFRAAFPGRRRAVTIDNITRALATFERALISGRSPYDRLVYDGDHAALSESAWRGMELFLSKRAHCAECHGGFNFAGPARYAGSPPARPLLVSNGVTSGRFRVPTLRNIALTAPYMHDGSIAALPDVIEAYSSKRRLDLTGQERNDLIAFLESLTDLEFVSDPRFADPTDLDR